MQDESTLNFNELKRRGITDEVITAFSISYSHSLPFAFKEGLIIPINYPDGKHFFNKYRRSYLNNDIKQKYAYDVGGRTALFGADKIRDLADREGPVVVTEGEMDALVLWSKNIPAVSSTGGAQSFQHDFVELLAGKKVYLCYDNDDAGAVGLVKTLELLPEAYVVFVPEVVGVKDISDFCSRGGDFHALMQTAKQYKTVADIEEDKQIRASQWLSVRFHNAWLEAHKPQNTTHASGVNYSGDDEFLKAKAVPCTQIIDFDRQKNAVCPFHNERSASLHYYPQKNNCYCFGSCGKMYDAIDLYMNKHNLSMKVAIKEMSKL